MALMLIYRNVHRDLFQRLRLKSIWCHALVRRFSEARLLYEYVLVRGAASFVANLGSLMLWSPRK